MTANGCAWAALWLYASHHRRLLRSDYPIESVLLGERRVKEIAPIIPAGIPIYVVTDPMVHQIIGYRFHSGVIVVGRRKPPMSSSSATISGFRAAGA